MSSKNVNSFSTIDTINTYSNSSLLGIVSGNLTRLTSGNLVLNKVNASNLIYNTGNQNISGRLVIGDTIVDASYPYTLSLQSNNQDTFLEILNSGGAGKGAFFGMNEDKFELYNWQGGDIIFITAENPSQGIDRLAIKNNGNIGIGTNIPSEKLEVDGNILANNLVYNTGNQTISGVKTFASRPTVNGTGVLLSGEASAIVLPNTLVYTTGDQTISGIKTFANNLIVSGSGIFNALDLNNIDVLSLSGIDVNIISGGVSLTNRPTVNGTGVLLQGQNSFIINLYNTSDTQSAGHNYFGNLSVGFDPNINNRKFPVLEACIVKKATWSQFNGTVGSPSLNSTGYFINTTTNVTGIISTTINTQNATTPNHYIADFSPPITISTGDYIACSLFGPNYTITFPATVRNSVNLYCYN